MMATNMNNLRIGIVGTGAMGYEHARVFMAQPNTALVGLHNRTRLKAEPMAAALGPP